MKRFQKTIAVLAAVSMLFSSPASYAYNKLYHTYSQTSTLSPGVTLTNEQRMTDSGWFNINLVTVDLTNPSVESTVLLPEYISNKATLMNLAQTEEGVVAAVNGDFFDTQGQSTLGMVVKDGEYITSSIHDERFYTYLQMKDGRSYIAKVLGESTKFSKGDFSIDVTYKNKPYLQFNRAILFDRSWGNASIGNTNSESVIEVVVVNDTVISVAVDPPPQKIPEDGYIIAAVGDLIPQVYANFKQGDKVSLKSSEFIKQVDQAIGGGAKILTNGAPESDFSLNISGRHPRSALGFSQDNKTLYLVTIDGRHGNFTGMTQTELAYYMAEAGAYNAINLDGGGSSEMVAKQVGQDAVEIINYPSDGVERRIHNGVGIKNVGEKGPVDQLLLDLEQERYFINSSINVNVSGIDKNYHPAYIDTSMVKVEASGIEHIIKDNEVIPLEEGEITITAKYGNVEGSVVATVIGEPKRLSVYPRTARLMPGETLSISLTGYDAHGFSAPLKLKDVNILQSGLKGDLVGSQYSVSEEGSGYIRFSLGDADAFLAVGVGENAQPLHDFEKQEGEFVSYPESVEGSYALTSFAHTGDFSGTLQFDFRSDTETRAAYVKFGESGLTLPQNTNKIRVWVYGDYATGQWLRGKATDATGKVHTIDFTKSVDWKGWQQVEASLPAGSAFKSLDRLYVVETDPAKRDAGVIVFDDLEAVVTAAPPENLYSMSASEFGYTNVEKDTADIIMDIKKPQDDSEQTSGDSATSNDPTPASQPLITLTGNRFIQPYNESVQVLPLNNSGKALSRTSASGGWASLLNFTPNDQSSQILVVLRESYGFKNDFDKKLFMDTLNSLRTTYGKRITVLSPDSRDTLTLMDGLWFATYAVEGDTQLMMDFDQDTPRIGKATVLSFD